MFFKIALTIQSCVLGITKVRPSCFLFTICLPFKTYGHIKNELKARGQRAEAKITTILQPVEQKPHSQKDRQNEKAEDYIPDEGTR